MPLCHYFHNVEDRFPARYATIYARGAVVNGDQANVNTVTVFAGHEISNGHKFIAFTNTGALLSERLFTVTSSGATSLTFSGEVASLPTRCILVGLGADTGSTFPLLAWDGSTLTMYKDPTGSVSWTNANVDVNPRGEFAFYGSGRPVWALVRSAYGKPTGVVIEVGPAGPVAAGGSALPSSGVPRQFFVLEQGTGLPDILYCWMKQASDTYDWVEVVSAP